MQQPSENKMGVLPVGRLLFSMAVPMMVSMLVQALYDVVDSYFVAKISENAFNAVSLSFPLPCKRLKDNNREENIPSSSPKMPSFQTVLQCQKTKDFCSFHKKALPFPGMSEEIKHPL